MKIVCINNIELGKDSYGKPRHKRLPITIGQIYEAEPDGIISLGKVNFYTLVKDNEEEGITYPSHYFVTIDVWREMQLNKLI
jgi:hypothetical protein